MSLTENTNKAAAFAVEYHKTIGSTNTYLKQLARAGAQNGTVVVADAQSNGRGRLGRSFFSPEGAGLYMSVLLRGALDIECVSKITPFAAVCVCEAINTCCGVRAGIKWVNDIIIKGKKVCGILAEAERSQDRDAPDFVVLGIGVNLKRSAFPEELSDIAGALEDFCSAPPERDALMREILGGLSPLLCGRVPEDTMKKYREGSILVGKSVYTLSEPSVSGICEDINDDGALIVRESNGILRKISAGEVSIREKI